MEVLAGVHFRMHCRRSTGYARNICPDIAGRGILARKSFVAAVLLSAAALKIAHIALDVAICVDTEKAVGVIIEPLFQMGMDAAGADVAVFGDLFDLCFYCLGFEMINHFPGAGFKKKLVSKPA